MELDMENSSPVAESSAGSSGRLTEPRRRNRPALSCIQCRTRKIRCDRSEPCASCIKSKIVNCTYEEARRPKPRLWRLSPAPDSEHAHSHSHSLSDSHNAEDPFPHFALTIKGFRDGREPRDSQQSSTNSSSGIQYAGSAASIPSVRTSETASVSVPSPATHHAESTVGGANPSITETLLKRINQLELLLSDSKRQDHSAAVSSQPPQSTPSQVPTGAGQGTIAKTMYFGTSHWMNGAKLFPLIRAISERIDSEKNSEIYFLIQKCKRLGKCIKSRRVPTHISFEVGKAIPPENTACRLVEAYFRTFESVYRILHAPTFWQDYHKYWGNPSSATQAFVVQFQLCMAIGTCFQDDPAFLRQHSSRWIYEAQVWLVSPSEKSRMTLAGLQVMCMLHLAKETCGVGSDLTWVSAGSLLRAAMYIGLHRDPDTLPKMSTLRAEMRRRLWATILEIVLQSSVDSGGPPLVSLSDFDTRHPANFDDDQLVESEHFSLAPRPFSTFTQTTVQLALLRSYPTRLAIAHHVNQFNSTVKATYEETLRWNSELTTACRALSATLQPSYDPAGVLPKRLSLFQLRLAEHMVHRFFLALNYPWLCSAQLNPAYYFSRKMCVEASLKLYRAFSTGSPAGASGTASQTDDFTRLLTCGCGAFRSVPTQAVLTICLELLWQAQEDRAWRQGMNIDHQLDRSGSVGDSDAAASGSIGSGAAPRQDLLEAAKYSLGWFERRIKAGETNIRGRAFFSAVLAQVQALQRNSSDAEVERAVLDALEDDLGYCWHLLKEAVGHATASEEVNGGYNGGLGPGMPGYDNSIGYECDGDDIGDTQGFNSIFNFDDVDFFISS
ncbi:hypothetical protein B0T17DRAFT_591589 [Bombardia bombarda]|uniref:Zn(2)-C6 fungal-type domain-containing protein n=1 Tax=Bombardia bombarda TaxID=252184 RepID=A0AA40C1X2_9PEZI|nr:hypothetical protein B0T17DRAFT_591589 [Bombardia bombarda]